MANKIKFKRGLKSKLPTLEAGEPAFCPDTRELFVGTGSGNINMGGSMWYKGTAMSGTVTTTGYYYYSACPQVKVGDTYLNTSNGNIYECTTAGSGQAAKWTYKGCIKGVQGGTGGTGPAGKGISSTAITYQSGTSATTAPTGTWQSTIPSVAAGNYLWTKIVITYTDSTTSTCYSVARQGADGSISGTNIAIGEYVFATGENSVALGGCENTASGDSSAVIGGGMYNNASGDSSAVIGGGSNTASGQRAVIIGGFGNTALAYQMKTGCHAKDGTAGTGSGTTGDALIIGNGTSSSQSNAFRVTYAGGVYGKAAYNSTGADYAEMFEWEDGNPNGEDRRGLFAYIVGDKIRLATATDTDRRRMGIISAYPAVVGDNFDEDWHGKYLTDIYGKPLTQTVHHDAVYDENGECIMEECNSEELIINPDYDPEMEYVPRAQRKEYAYWSFIGKLVVRDDGTCVEGGYCYPGTDGIATACIDSDKGYYVMERLDDNHVRVLVR